MATNDQMERKMCKLGFTNPQGKHKAIKRAIFPASLNTLLLQLEEEGKKVTSINFYPLTH
ncbi:MAG TPA: hypothetical protein VF817_05185 [Patescibacteria group bacterium]